MPVIAVLILSLLSVASIFVIFWGGKRGLDLTDEGFALCGLANPRHFPGALNGDRYLSSVLWKLCAKDIPNLRRLTWLLNSLVALFMGSCFIRAMAVIFPPLHLTVMDQAAILLAFYLSSLTFYMFLREVLYYNFYMGLVQNTILASFLLSVSCENTSRLPILWLFPAFLTGLLCGFSLFIKPTTAIILLFFYGLLLLSTTFHRPLPQIAEAFAAPSAGALAAIGVHHCFFQPIPAWLKDSLRILSILRASGVTMGASRVFFKNLIRYGVVFLSRAWYVLTAYALTIAASSLFKSTMCLYIAFVVSSGCAVFYVIKNEIYLCYFSARIEAPTKFVYMLVLAASAMALAAALSQPGHPRPVALPVILDAGLLLALPFAATYGTGNPILYITNYGLGAPVVVILFFLQWIKLQLADNVMMPMVLIAMGLIFTSQFITAYVFRPYRIPSLLTQNTPIRLGNSNTQLLLDADEALFISELRKVTGENGFRAWDDVVAYASMPGVIFALGASSPIVHTIFDTWHATGDLQNVTRLYFLDVPPQRRQRCWILFARDDGGERFLDVLKSAGCSLPGTHKLVGELFNPWQRNLLQIWKPRPPG